MSEYSVLVRCSVDYSPEDGTFHVVPPEAIDTERVWNDTTGWADEGHEEVIKDADHILAFELDWNKKAHEFLRLYYRGLRSEEDEKRFEILRVELDTQL